MLFPSHSSLSLPCGTLLLRLLWGTDTKRLDQSRTGLMNTLGTTRSSLMWDEVRDPREIVLEQGLTFDELLEDQARRRGTMRVRWASIAVHRRCSMEGCCTTPSSELSDGGGVAARREGDIPGEAGKYSSSSRSPTTGAWSWERSVVGG